VACYGSWTLKNQGTIYILKSQWYEARVALVLRKYDYFSIKCRFCFDSYHFKDHPLLVVTKGKGWRIVAMGMGFRMPWEQLIKKIKNIIHLIRLRVIGKEGCFKGSLTPTLLLMANLMLTQSLVKLNLVLKIKSF
jgi:hypothetical protein